jgi:RNA-binding protein
LKISFSAFPYNSTMTTSSTSTVLTSQARSALRSAAHSLKPHILIGDQGLSPAVMKEIAVALTAHELIKIRASGQERQARIEMLDAMCAELGCSPVHHLGKTLIVYRRGKKGVYDTHVGHIPLPPKRKANEPHTPKKMAALGKKVTKRVRPVKSESESTSSAIKAFSAEKPTRPTSKRPNRQTTNMNPSRKSALSLRAGVRRRSS